MWWTLLAATVGSLTALYIAKFIYPQQKEIDRQSELRRERRAAYREFFKEVIDVQDAFDRLEFKSSEEANALLEKALAARRSFERALLLVAVSATPKVIQAISGSQVNLDRLGNDLQVTLRDIMEENSTDLTGEQWSRRIHSAVREARLSYEHSNQVILNAIRFEEFGHAGEVSYTSRRYKAEKES